MYFKSLLRAVFLLLITVHTSVAFSQSNGASPTGDRGNQLAVVQSVLQSKLTARSNIRKGINTALPDDIDELESKLVAVNDEITDLRESFEQIAVGSVDLSVFKTAKTEFDWKNEMTQVMMPIIRNMQSLTEKPRKIEALRTEINLLAEQLDTANAALFAIEKSITVTEDEPAIKSLISLQKSWTNRAAELERDRGVSSVRLDNLLTGDGNFFETLKTGVVSFVAGRGLTILLAIVSATCVWYLAKFLSKILLSRKHSHGEKTFRTRQRLVQYGFNIMTGFLSMVTVIVVFYIRGDVLLLGISFLFAGAALLGLRNIIPKFITEAKVLLNLGSIRENERVIYNGLPFRVISLNMYSVLRNPELTGVIRLPLDSLIGMISRPAGNELWFPASKGDFIMMPDDKLLEVLELTPELINLQNLAGTKTSVPSADFYHMTFDNLSRGETFAIVSSFGIGYSHQEISNKGIPVTLQNAIAAALSKTTFAEDVVSVGVELKEAGASSLDYWVCVTLASTAARAYYKVNRLVQQTCVDICTAESWEIPFPQLTIHKA